MRGNRPSWIKILLALLLLVGVPIFVWAVMTQRIELRKKAGYAGPTLTMIPGTVDGNAGQEFTLAISLSTDTASVSATEIHIAYNPQIVHMESFTPGSMLPVILSPAEISTDSGTVSVVLGAQPNSPATGTDIVGSIKFTLINNNPTGINFLPNTIVTVIGQSTNALIAYTGAQVNGGTPPPTHPTSGPQPECGSCKSGCASGLVCQYVPTPTPNCSNGPIGPCVMPVITPYQACVKPDGSSKCPIQPTVCFGHPDGDQCETVCTESYPPHCTSGTCQNSVCVHGTNPTPEGPTPTPTFCEGSDGSSCTLTTCPICAPGQICPRMPCKAVQGTCQNNRCIANPIPTPTPQGWCPGPNGTSCQTTWSTGSGNCTPSPTISCPTLLQFMSGICQNNQCIFPTPTPPQGCYYSQVCTESYPPNCKINLNCPQTTTSPTPSPGTLCIRNAPTVTISPYNQSGNPGDTLNYIATVRNNDAVSCTSALFTFSTQVPNGFTAHLGTNSMTLPPQGTSNITYSVTSPSPNANSSTQTVPISFTAKTENSLFATTNASYTYIKPSPITLKFNLKLAGVTGDQAANANQKVSITFARQDNSIATINDLPLTHIGNGIYQTEVTITNPPPATIPFTVVVKGPKHGAVRFCQQTGQTAPCTFNQFMTLNGNTFDFTGRPLPAGDLNHDSKIDAADIKLLTDLFSKPSSQITDTDRATADVNYDGYIDGQDLNLLLQSLAVRPDE